MEQVLAQALEKGASLGVLWDSLNAIVTFPLYIKPWGFM
jgi:RNAse (barnase) inhibitor barstar